MVNLTLHDPEFMERVPMLNLDADNARVVKPEVENGCPAGKVPREQHRLRRIAFVVTLMAIGLAVGLVATTWKTVDAPNTNFGTRASLLDVVTFDNLCADFPHLNFTRVIHNNLGGHGPDDGPETLIYSAVDTGTGTGKEVLLQIKVDSGTYDPHYPLENGLNGEYGSINIKPGTQVHLAFEIIDADTLQMVNLPKVYFTFFDLDHGPARSTIESVTADNFNSVMTTIGTELISKKNKDGSRTFTATTEGSGEDNPTNPLLLTLQQKNRAVSFEFVDFTQMHVTLAATPGMHPRYFTFICEPTLLCAETLKDDTQKNPNEGEDEVVLIPGPNSTEEEIVEIEQCCMIFFGWDIFCRESKEWWTFWC